MGTLTSKTEQTYHDIIVCSTDLGEIKRISLLDFYNENVPVVSEQSSQYDDGYSRSRDETIYESHCAVVFIPYNGVRIDQIAKKYKSYSSQVQIINGELYKPGTYETGDKDGFGEEEESSSESDGSEYIYHLNDFHYVERNHNYSSNDCFSLFPRGSYVLGYEKSYVNKSEYIDYDSYQQPNDDNFTSVSKNWTKYVISGVKNENKLTIFGHNDTGEVKMYKWLNGNGDWQLMIDGSIDKSRVSNLIMFDAPTFPQSSWFSIHDIFYGNHTERIPSHSQEPSTYTPGWERYFNQDQTGQIELSVSSTNDLNDVKGAYLYIDCFFVTVSPYLTRTKLSGLEEKDAFSSYSMTIPMIYPQKDGSGNITYHLTTRTRVANAKLELEHGDVDGFPAEHEWYKKIKHYFKGATVSIDDENMEVQLVNKDNIRKIFDNVNAVSKYCRATDYWINLDSNKLLNDRSTFSESPEIRNKFFVKLFKPYACAILDIGCNDPLQTFNYESFADLFLMVRENIRQDTLANKYIKLIQVDGWNGASKDNNINDIKRYAKVLSPLRLELYRSHGGRYEYDKDRPANQLNGEWEIQFAGNFCLHSGNFRWLHDGLYKWSFYIPQSPLNYIIYSESCFGGGIKIGTKRNIYGMENEISDSQQLFSDPGIRMSGLFNAGALYTGTSWGFSLLNKIINNISTETKRKTGKNVTYKEMTQKINNLYRNARAKMYTYIKDFYVKNYDLMIRCLANPEHVQMWNDTKNKILADLDNSGMTYFGSYDWDYDDPNFVCSDNYFFPEQRKYPIHDGFVGFIKQEVLFKCSKYNKNKGGRKFFQETNTIDDETLAMKTKELCVKIFRLAKETLGLKFDDTFQDDIFQDMEGDATDAMREELQRNGDWDKYRMTVLFIIGLICGTYSFVDRRLAESNATFGSYPEKHIQDWLIGDSELKTLYDNKTEIN